MRAGKLKEYEAAIVADRKTLAGSYRESAPVDSCLDMSKLKLYPSINKLPEVPISFRGVSSKAFQQAYIGRWNQAHEKGMIWSGDVQPRDTIVGQYTAAD
jgi:hypothetical protein